MLYWYLAGTTTNIIIWGSFKPPCSHSPATRQLTCNGSSNPNCLLIFKYVTGCQDFGSWSIQVPQSAPFYSEHNRHQEHSNFQACSEWHKHCHLWYPFSYSGPGAPLFFPLNIHHCVARAYFLACWSTSGATASLIFSHTSRYRVYHFTVSSEELL